MILVDAYNSNGDSNMKDLLVEAMKTTLELDKWKEKHDLGLEALKNGNNILHLLQG